MAKSFAPLKSEPSIARGFAIYSKNILLFFTGRYRKYLLTKVRKKVWEQYYPKGFTNTGWQIQESIKEIR